MDEYARRVLDGELWPPGPPSKAARRRRAIADGTIREVDRENGACDDCGAYNRNAGLAADYMDPNRKTAVLYRARPHGALCDKCWEKSQGSAAAAGQEEHS
jgi:hypothetical protein